MKKILTLAIVTVLFFSTSCTKGDLDVSVSGEIQIGPVLLSWGNTGTYGNYYGGLPGYGVDYFIGFIGAKPTDGNNISILTSTGAPLCVASCTATYWQDANDFYNVARNATYPPLRPVLIKRLRNTMTNAPDDFYLVGY